MNKLILILLLLFANSTLAATRWHWQDEFSKNEQKELINWIVQADQGVRTLFGSLPYPYDVYFYRQQGGEPVPWAHTSKGATKAVHFYVNMDYSQSQFIKDWTASHELSHLLFPYIGSNSAWFSEGIASYLQYQIMYANKVINWQQGVKRLEERYNRARALKSNDLISIAELSKIVRQTGAYVRLYWGGAAYFNYTDKRLHQEKGIRLNDVIREYLACCSLRRIKSADEMMILFDQISNSTIFKESYLQTVSKKGFPETKNLTSWLKKNPPRLLK